MKRIIGTPESIYRIALMFDENLPKYDQDQIGAVDILEAFGYVVEII